MDSQTDKAKKIEEMKVLEQEMKSLKKGARVYKQQQNSGIFFKAEREKVFEECKRTLDDLVQEYKAVEETQHASENDPPDG